jgi:hypothetical protein
MGRSTDSFVQFDGTLIASIAAVGRLSMDKDLVEQRVEVLRQTVVALVRRAKVLICPHGS